MASVNRILEKRRKAQNNNSQAPAQNIPSSNQSNTNTSNNPQKALYDPQREKTFAPYVQYLPYNPSSFQYSNKYMPFNLSLYNKYRMPLSCFINPVNEELQYTQRSANQIIRCGSCRAYINYYTEVTKKGYRCSLCGRDNNFDSYVYDAENIQCKQPSYLVDGPSGIYNDTPPENVVIFLIDVSHQAYQCKMLSYLVMVLKDIFSKQQSNQTQLHFYTYDETIHEYDFSGTQVQRTILDFSIKTSPNNKITDCFIEQIRDKLMIFLDSLEEMAQKNTKNGSNFYSALEYVYENVRRTGGKIYIFQASQAIIGQSFLNQNIKPAPGQQTLKPKSILETKNKLFFNRFVQPMLVDNISMAFFIFGKSYKNIRIYSDTCKLTNSELMYYSKEVPEEINKFYYQLYNILNATYYIDTRIQLIISSGWYYTAVYGNLYRLKEHISFKFCHWERSKRICAVFLPQEGFNPMPYFSMQIITNYIYGRKHYMSVNTAMVPFTTSIQTLFQNTNYNISSSSLYKSYLSSLRLEQANGCRNKYISQVALIYKSAFQFYQGKIPGEVRSTILGFLGFLKSYHSQVQIINDTLILQRIITQRNLLQSCSYLECSSAFCPYLFDLTSIGSDRCLQDNFIYPDTVQLKFSSVKEGLFLMDAGPTLYLYISKSCHQNYIFSLFGKPKLSKTDILNEQLISSQANDYSYRIMTLLRTIRELKTYGWAPLYIIRCGQNSINEKNFYLNFYEQKYEEYHGYKITYDQFVNLLSKNNKN